MEAEQVMPVGDLDRDGDVDFFDFSVFALTWQSEPGADLWHPASDMGLRVAWFVPQWNSDSNVSLGTVRSIDTRDLAPFVDNWLAGTEYGIGDWQGPSGD